MATVDLQVVNRPTPFGTMTDDKAPATLVRPGAWPTPQEASTVAKRICSVAGCERAAKVKGMCQSHYARSWARAHPENARAAVRRWTDKNREHVRAYDARRRQENPAYFQAKDRKRYYAAGSRRHLDSLTAIYNGQARSFGVASDFTTDDWLSCLEENGFRCFHCGAADVDLQRDHLTPMRRGGSNTKDNIVPSCGFCNNQKRTRTLAEYLEWKEAKGDGLQTRKGN